MRAIREHHKDTHITLITAPPFAAAMKKSGLFDEVWGDDQPKFWQLIRAIGWMRKLRSGHFTRVYDLQIPNAARGITTCSNPSPNGRA